MPHLPLPAGAIDAAFDEAPVGLAIAGPNGRFLRVNRAFAGIFGYAADEMSRLSWDDLLHDDRPDAPIAIGRLPTDVETTPRRCRHHDGHAIWVEATSRVVRDDAGTVQFEIRNARDVTEQVRASEERRLLEQQLRRAQRMEAVGRLAGGIAHDFNNMLSVILNYADFARRLSADGRARDYLDAIRKGALRAAGLTRQLLIFGRRDTATPTVLDVNAVMRDLEKLLRRTIGEDVELDVRLAPDLPPVFLALPHAEQVLMNLVVNARDAMPRGGRLFVGTSTVELTEHDVKNRLDAHPGRYVCVTVQDTGIGMTEEVLALAFDPFFTTKEPGEGTGLGLSIVYGIVQEAGGHIDVISAPGIGTTFRVLVPVTAQAATEPTPYVDGPPQGRGETVLVVEDEPAVRALTVQILRENGYVVQEAESAEYALELCRKATKPFDLLLTDVIMPRMSGADLATVVRAMWHRTRVLFMSGYAADRLDQYRRLNAEVVFLQKPFNGDELLTVMRRVLDEDAE